MKTLQTIALCGILLSGFISCSKEKKEILQDNTEAIYDTYTGRQGDGVEEPENFLQLKLDDQGNLLSFSSNKALPGWGSWKISNNKFTASYVQKADYKTIMLQGAYDPIENKISGTWGYGNFASGGGSFHVEKKATKIAAVKKKSDFSVDVLLHRYF